MPTVPKSPARLPFRRLVLLPGFVSLLLCGCGTGYVKSGNNWTYVVVNEAVGREVHKINADAATFRVLENPVFACDKNHVYKFGYVVPGLDGATFKFLDGKNYSQDASHIYFEESIISDADPASFEILAYPYSRDAKHVYCGSLRMNVALPKDFRVLSSEGVAVASGVFYATEELVERLGEEFENHRIKYDPQKKDMRFVVIVPSAGAATDGVWNYKCAMRTRRVD